MNRVHPLTTSKNIITLTQEYQSGVTYYNLLLHSDPPVSLRKRYSEFEQLNTALALVKGPSFPPKHILKNEANMLKRL